MTDVPPPQVHRADDSTARSSIDAVASACGAVPTGDPPSMTLDVLGRAVHVTLAEGDGHPPIVHLGASCATGTTAAGSPGAAAALEAASAVATGDTRFVAREGSVEGRRTLLAPDPTTCFDALWDLAKSVVVLADPPHDGGGDLPAAAPAPPEPEVPYWCFVDQRTEVHAAADGASEVVAMLIPGVWYEVRADDGTWVRVAHPSGAEGFVPRAAVTRS